MARDSILDEAEQNEANNESGSEAEDESGGSDERVRVTQRIPKDLADDVERVQEEYSLPSRNATINFMLKHAAKDL